MLTPRNLVALLALLLLVPTALGQSDPRDADCTVGYRPTWAR